MYFFFFFFIVLPNFITDGHEILFGYVHVRHVKFFKYHVVGGSYAHASPFPRRDSKKN